jgi:hypothetical protein
MTMGYDKEGYNSSHAQSRTARSYFPLVCTPPHVQQIIIKEAGISDGIKK